MTIGASATTDTFRLPEHDPVYALHTDPDIATLGRALATGTRLQLDFQWPGCDPGGVTLWLDRDARAGGGIWRVSWDGQPDFAPSFIFWPAVLVHLGQLSYRADWRVVSEGVTR